MRKNSLPAAANPGKMAGRAHRDHAAAEGTAITLQEQGLVKFVEIATDEAMSPDAPVATTHTAVGTRPGIVTSQIMNLLEINGDLPYHEISKYERGVGPESKKGGEFAKTLRPFLLTALKKPFAKGPNCLTFSFNRLI